MKQVTAAIRVVRKARAPFAPPPPPHDLSRRLAYTLGELTAMGLGCKSFIYNQIGAGRLKATKRGRYTIVLAPDLDAWVASLPAIKPRSGSTGDGGRAA